MRSPLVTTLAALLLASGPLAARADEGPATRCGCAERPHGDGLRIGNPFYFDDPTDPAISYVVDGWRAISQCLVGLARADDLAGTLDLDAARSVSVSEDGLVWRFRLQGDLVWSDGVPLTASDFEYGIKRALDPRSNPFYGTGGPAYYLTVIEGAGALFYTDPAAPDDEIEAAKALVAVTAESETALVIRLAEPVGDFLATLAMPVSFAVRRDVVEAGRRPTEVASGAYTMRLEGESRIVFERNPHRHARRYRGQIERFVWVPAEEDPAANVEAFLRGDVDLLAANTFDLLAARSDPALAPRVVDASLASLMHLVFNTQHGPTANEHVRRALTLAADRPAVSTATFGSEVYAAQTFAPSNLIDSPRRPEELALPFDEGRALAEAALAGGDFPATIDVVAPPGTTAQRLAAAVAASWNSVFGPGFAQVVTRDYDVYYDMFFGPAEDQPPVAFASWIADTLAVRGIVEPLFTGGGYANLSRWQSDELDALLLEAAPERRARARRAIYADAERLLADEAPVLGLFRLPWPMLAPEGLDARAWRVEEWRCEHARGR